MGRVGLHALRAWQHAWWWPPIIARCCVLHTTKKHLGMPRPEACACAARVRRAPDTPDIDAVRLLTQASVAYFCCSSAKVQRMIGGAMESA